MDGVLKQIDIQDNMPGDDGIIDISIFYYPYLFSDICGEVTI